jgi:hypothetical protein
MLDTVDAELKRIESAAQKDRIEIDPASPTPGFDYLCATVRDPRREHHDRVRAARELLPFEKPKLSAQQLVHIDGSWADRLDKAVERSERARLNGNGAKVVNPSKLIEGKPNEPEPVQRAQVNPADVRRV